MAEETTDERLLRAACADQALRFVRQLSTPFKEGHLASGVAIKIEGYHFIATVEHFLGKATFFKIVRRKTEQEMAGSFKNVICSPSLDLGLIELTEDQASCLEAFAGPENILATSTFEEDTALFVIGFPSSTYQHVPPYRFCIATTYDTVPLLPAQWPDNLWNSPSKDTDILLDLPDETENRLHGPGLPLGGTPPRMETPPEPHGMSGGGIWRPVWNRRSVQRPAVQLVGIQSSFWDRPRLLRGLHIKCWLEFVADNYPELTEPIEEMLAKTMDFQIPRDET